MPGREVLALAHVPCEVVQLPRGAGLGLDGLPVAFAHRYLAHELPIEVLVLRLRAARGGRSEQLRHEAQAVNVGRQRRPAQFGDGRKDIREIPEMVAHAARGDAAGPARDDGHAQAALVQLALLAAKLGARARILVGAVDPAGELRADEVVRATVVPAEEYERVLFEAEFPQEGENLPHLAVEQVHHRGVAAGGLGPGPVAEERPGGIVIGNIEVPVRRGEGQVGEEGPVAALADEAHRLVEDHVLGVGRPLAIAPIAGQRDLGAVPDEVGRVVGVGVDLVVIAEEHVEALALGHAGGAAAAHAPFAEAAGRIAEGF